MGSDQETIRVVVRIDRQHVGGDGKSLGGQVCESHNTDTVHWTNPLAQGIAEATCMVSLDCCDGIEVLALALAQAMEYAESGDIRRNTRMRRFIDGYNKLYDKHRHTGVDGKPLKDESDA